MDKIDFETKEKERLELMKAYEKEYVDLVIAGIDEAGRGPLAGPVVAACVVLDLNYVYYYLNDLKKVTEKRREVLYDEIINNCYAYGIGIVDNKIIDKINILEATHIAMKEAYDNCNKSYYDKYNRNIDVLLVDALNIKNIDIKQVPIIKGDSKSISIAAASILAKVTRDRIMLELDKKYPLYGFNKHKGYGTKVHIDALKKYGKSDIHRESFIKNIC